MKMMSQAQIVKHKIKYRHKNTKLFFNSEKFVVKVNEPLTVAGADGRTVA
jgi:hypothetical protein